MEKPLNQHLYVVILCGGGGTRLWPLSRNKSPKQFIELVGPETLFAKTLARAKRLVEPSHIFVMTNKAYLEDVTKHSDGIPAENIVTEPEKKNTAMAMGVIAGIIHTRDPHAVVINLASDHLIGNEPGFVQAMRAAAQVAAKGERIITVGITPTFPHTGLGYIHADGSLGSALDFPVYQVEGFREKPDEVTAAKFLQAGNYYWNANLYTWTTALILEEFARLAPHFYAAIQKIMQAYGTPSFSQVLADEYHQAKEEQIDTAISERTDKLAVIPGDFGWTDIGSWNVVHDEVEKDGEGNALISREAGGEWLRLDSKNTLVSTSKKMIVTIGVENLVVVDTPDALLITHKDKAQDVKKVVESLKADDRRELL